MSRLSQRGITVRGTGQGPGNLREAVEISRSRVHGNRGGLVGRLSYAVEEAIVNLEELREKMERLGLKYKNDLINMRTYYFLLQRLYSKYEDEK